MLKYVFEFLIKPQNSMLKILFISCIAISLFFSSCSHQQTHSNTNKKKMVSISNEDKVWMKEFFRKILLEEETPIYTIFGTKPLSGFAIDRGAFKEFKKDVQTYISDLSKEDLECIKRYTKKHENDETFARYWDKWLNFIKQYPNSPFLFLEKPSHLEGTHNGYILNIQEMVWTLKKHYAIFQQETQMEFDPLKITLEFPLFPLFWEKVFQNSYLLGICFGFGEKNAYLFTCCRMRSCPDSQRFYTHDYFKNVPTKSTWNDLSIPSFCSFYLPFAQDPVVEDYYKQKAIIQSHLNEKNFFERTLNQMTGNF